ncbi:MAG: hypothetical protein R2795_22950 [Saprospiraceae bacterium]
MGSRKYHTLSKPSVALLVGNGVTSYEAGTNWHLLDVRYQIPVTKLDVTDMGRHDLARYNVIIMPNGRYSFSASETDKLRQWVSKGGVLIAQKSANRWCAANGLAQLTERKPAADSHHNRPYGSLEADSGGRVLGGAIFEASADLTHPLLYGCSRTDMAVFMKDNLFYEPAQNAYATPLRFTASPYLSGYVHSSSLAAIKESAAIVVSGKGSGTVVSMAFEPAFRAFWFGTSKLLGNAVFFGHTIESGGKEMVK